MNTDTEENAKSKGSENSIQGWKQRLEAKKKVTSLQNLKSVHKKSERLLLTYFSVCPSLTVPRSKTENSEQTFSYSKSSLYRLRLRFLTADNRK